MFQKVRAAPLRGWALNKKTVFLFDGIGALFSAVLSGLVLPRFSELLGLPVEVFHFLAALAGFFMVYSLSCYLFVREAKSWMLSLIISANLFYCMVSIGLLIAFREPVTLVGATALVMEI